MNNKVYFGEYTLRHWIDLMVSGNIVLPDYQRTFIWDKAAVKKLIDSIKKGYFVPPVIIGLFKHGGKTVNYIIDGQQRLSSLLLTFFNVVPSDEFKVDNPLLADENDDETDTGAICGWTLRHIIPGATNIDKVEENIIAEINKYEKLYEKRMGEGFFYKYMLPFCYLVPDTSNPTYQLRYYPNVFRNINSLGAPLKQTESRRSLYFLKEGINKLFEPEFARKVKVKRVAQTSDIDFVRYLALLFQYHKNPNKATLDSLMSGYDGNNEAYYNDFILAVVEDSDNIFAKFTTIFPDGQYTERLNRLSTTLDELGLDKEYSSIIDADVVCFGLIYQIFILGNNLDVARKDGLKSKLKAVGTKLRGNKRHKKSPGNLKYLRERIEKSLDIYATYVPAPKP